MRASIIVFPATNREKDAAMALRRASGKEPTLVWHQETTLPPSDLVVLPGGFAHGDYLRCGAMAARAPIMEAVRAHAEAGGAIIGICNGFQVLTESGLLPGALIRNDQLKFICRPVSIRVETAESDFTRAYEAGSTVTFPVAHGEGNYVCDDETLTALEDEDRVAFRYVTSLGETSAAGNINGSRNNIAGILSKNRRVLGLMPHPEDATDPLVAGPAGGLDGQPLFKAMAEAFA